MKSIYKYHLLAYCMLLMPFVSNGQSYNNSVVAINIYPDSILNDVSNHPIGINLNYFMDDDNHLKPARRTVDALKAMGVKYLRYPGGNKSDYYFFSKPPYEKSEPTLARTGKFEEPGMERILNDQYNGYKVDVLDFDEFIALCREIGAEPVLVVAADEYLVDYPVGNLASTRKQLMDHAVEWVRYANIKKNYKVKYWMIGNECWHESNPNSSLEIYANDVVDFSKAMKAVDPSIQIIPNGNSEEYWKTVLTIAAGHIDAICISNYSVFNFKSAYATYRDTLNNFMEPAQRALKAIDDYASPIDRNKLKLIVAEYGPFDWSEKWPFVNNMGYNLANFEITGEQLLEPRIQFSCFWNTRWINNDIEPHSVFDALDKNGGFNAIGLGMMIWGNFLGNKMVKSSSTLHIRTFASSVPEEKKLFVYLLNKSVNAQLVQPKIKGVKSISQVWELRGNGSDDTNPIWEELKDIEFNKPQLLPGTTIRVIQYRMK